MVDYRVQAVPPLRNWYFEHLQFLIYLFLKLPGISDIHLKKVKKYLSTSYPIAPVLETIYHNPTIKAN